MKKVRLGIIGLGQMGLVHARSVVNGLVSRCELSAVADVNEKAAQEFPLSVYFQDANEMLRSGKVDAVLISTPHLSHVPLGIDALKAGLHVLMEKPLCVHKAEGEQLLQAHVNPEQVFAIMFNQRTNPCYQKLRQFILDGELGEIRRIQWTVTDWFRTNAYYASGKWRGTWAGEGGGVLLNQCPHNLDLWQWIFGMPQRVHSWCNFGRYHSIEVEDDVVAHLDYQNGTKGIFITSTGEAPGINRLEVAAEQGLVIIEDDRMTYRRNEKGASLFNRESGDRMGRPAVWNVEIPFAGSGGQHIELINNFVRSILDGEKLIAPASEGIKSIELINALLLSSFTDQKIDLPIDAEKYKKALDEKKLLPVNGRE